MRRARRRREGFTLIELIVVIAIIALLAAMLMPAMANVMDDARITKNAQQMNVVKTGLNRYLADLGSYPPSISAWGRSWGDDPGVVQRGYVWGPHQANWKGPYVERWYMGTPWATTAAPTSAYYFHTPIGWYNNGGWPAARDHYIHMNPYVVYYPPANGLKIDMSVDDGVAGAGICRVTGGVPEYVYYLVGEGPTYQ